MYVCVCVCVFACISEFDKHTSELVIIGGFKPQGVRSTLPLFPPQEEIRKEHVETHPSGFEWPFVTPS